MAKDLFSTQAKFYAKYRPTYPEELYQYVLSFVNDKEKVWDCATGNGQAAQVLANFFKQVEATDISEDQLSNAIQKPNIHYQVSPAEKTPFSDSQFDLITLATAYHWLNWDKFHEEAQRVGKKDCVVAAWAYHLFYSDDKQINEVIKHFYNDIVYTYWDPERKYMEQAYATVKFDFKPLPSKEFKQQIAWNKEQFFGYLQSWSAVQNYIKKNGASPVDLIRRDVELNWKDGAQKGFDFPIFMRIGRIEK
jgi:ubiquinone/menaquinone biosynthesis C-methylase UbiE